MDYIAEVQLVQPMFSPVKVAGYNPLLRLDVLFNQATSVCNLIKTISLGLLCRLISFFVTGLGNFTTSTKSQGQNIRYFIYIIPVTGGKKLCQNIQE